MTSYVFITGGVVSSLGKGITSACLGAILEARGLSISMIKLDPYLNVDPGTMSPFQHGEVFVTHDGTGRNDRPGSDRHPWEDRDTRTDPDSAPDAYGNMARALAADRPKVARELVEVVSAQRLGHGLDVQVRLGDVGHLDVLVLDQALHDEGGHVRYFGFI